MNDQERRVLEFVRKQWDAEGACCSCGWHASLSEYGHDDEDITSVMEINVSRKRAEFQCLSKDADDAGLHRGVRIYLPPEILGVTDATKP